MSKFVALCLVAVGVGFFALTSEADGQLFRRRTMPTLPTCPMCVEPSCESRPAVPSVPQPSLPTWEAGESSLSVQSIALEPVPGTGSKSAGLLSPGRVMHSLDPASLNALKEMLAGSGKQTTLSIAPLMDDATSQRLLHLLDVSKWLLYLLLAIGGSSLGKTYLPWAAPAASGLLRLLAAASQKPTAAATEPTSK